VVNSGRLERSLQIAASPAIVFSFFTDPNRLIRWKGISATLDPRPGGSFNLDINGSDKVIGEYLEVVPNQRLEFTWRWEGGNPMLPTGDSRVEVTLQAHENGTLLRLRHSGLPEWAVGGQGQGWDHYLPQLIHVAEAESEGNFRGGAKGGG